MGAFQAGDVVVERVGAGGATALSGSATAVFLDEYALNGTLVQTIALPTADAGTQHALTASGTATSEGLISTSADGSALLVAGYDAAPGTAAVASTTAAAAPRVVATVDRSGAVDTSTVLTGALGGNNVRSATSADGKTLYASGAGGAVTTSAGSSAAPTSLDATNTRQLEVAGGQLYYSTGSGTPGIYALGSGLPTAAGQTGTLLPGTAGGTGANGSSPYGFAFVHLAATGSGNDTLYVADSGVGIEKFSLVNGSFVANGQVAFAGVTGLAASVSNGTVTLVASNTASLDTLTDSSGFNAAINGTLKTVATAGTNTVFRGLALAPTAAAAGTPTPATSVTIGNATYVRNTGGSMTESFTVTRSDTGGAFTLNYATADGTAKAGTDYAATNGTLTFAAGGAATQTVSVPVLANASAPASESYTLNLSNLASTSGRAAIGTASGTGTIVTPTPIYVIQGSGLTSPLAGQSLTTDGVVTAVGSSGYYIQDPIGDGNAATSDGLYVFTSTAPTTKVGDFVDVSGTVQEYKASTAPGALSVTELSNVTATQTVSTGNALPAPVVIGPDGRVPPTSDLAAGNSFYESLEGMRVTVETPQAVGPTNQYGEIETVSGDGQGATGLNAKGDLLIQLGQPSFGNTDTQGGDFNPERIKIDGGLVAGAVPSVNVGTQFTSTTGIVNYAFDQFGVSATSPLTVAKASTITPTVGTLAGDAGHVTVASYNIENFSLSAQGQSKVDAVAGQIVKNLDAPDIVALQEVQDNSGPTDDGTTSASANLNALIASINAQGGPQYAALDNPFIGNDTNGGQPGGNIRTAFLYRTDRVTVVPGSLATVAGNGAAIHDAGTPAADAQLNMDQQTNLQNPFYSSRPVLSAQFVVNGQPITVVDNHFTSKGGSGDLMGSVQPPLDGGEVERAAQAQAVNTYVAGLLQANPAAKVVVTGDLNEFNGEEPLRVLAGTATVANYQVPPSGEVYATASYTPNGNAPILTDLESTLPADQQYDYVFQGNSESLVHTLATTNLAAGAQLQVIHVNSEYANQTSDHDPLLASFALAAPVCFAGGTRIRTARGEVAVEALRVGDLAVTAGGALRPIRWIGHRTIDPRRHPRPAEAQPVRIRAHSFGHDRPARDLAVSPGHAIGLDVVGEVLVPAGALCNGATIVQQQVARVTYWHVELDAHDLLLAEGLAAESYLDMGNRGFFAGSPVVVLAAAPDAPEAAAPPCSAIGRAGFCRPFHAAGAVVEAVRAQTLRRAALLGHRPAEAAPPAGGAMPPPRAASDGPKTAGAVFGAVP